MSTYFVQRSDHSVALPGTSAALTARTIDATQHPVAQARDAVAEVPRLVDSIPPHLVGGALGLTGVILMLSLQKYRLSMSPVLLAGLLMMPVSNYREGERPAVSTVVETPAVEKKRVPAPEWFERPSRAEAPEPPRRPESPRSFPDFSLPSVDIEIPPELMEEAGAVIELVVPEEWDREDVSRYLRRNSERLKREIRRLRSDQQREARRLANEERRHTYEERRRANEERRRAYSMEHRYSQ